MKFDNETAFEKHLKGAIPHHLLDVYLVLSKDQYELKALAQQLVQAARHAYPSLEMRQFEGMAVSAEELGTELNSIPFLASKILVWVRDVDQLKPAAKDVLVDYLERPSTRHLLLMSGESVPANTHLFKKSEKQGIVVDMRKQDKPWEKEQSVSEWLVKYAAERGKTLKPHLAKEIVAQVGAERALLEQEMNKVMTFVGDKSEISQNDVAQICLKLTTESIWSLGESVMSLDAATALRVWKSLIEDPSELLGLLRQLRGQLQKGFHICSLLHAGGSPQEVMQAYPYMKGNILSKNIQLAQKYGMKRFAEAMVWLDKTELEAKNSSINPEVLAERLLLKIT